MNRVLFLFSLLFSVFSHAQSSPWTLRACIEYAIENNINVQQALVDVDVASIEKSLALGQMLPNVNANIGGSSNRGLGLNPATNQLENVTMMSASGALSASVVLFEGLKRQRQLQQAKINELAVSYRLDKMKDDIVLHVTNAFLQIVLNKENLELIRSQNKISIDQLERTAMLVDAGVIPQGDLLEIRANDAREKQRILEAENQVRISLISLAQLLKISEYQKFDISKEEFLIDVKQNLNEPSVEEYLNKAKETRSEIKIAESNVALAEKNIEITKASHSPSLSASFGYTTRYAENDPTSFRKQLSLNDGIGYGLQLNIPIFNGLAVRNQVRRSELSLEKARFDMEQAELELESSVYQAYLDMTGAEKTFEAAQVALDAQKLAFEHSQNRFDAGLITAFEFSQAKMQYDQSMVEVNQAKYNYIFKQKVLELYFGVPYSEF